MGHVSVLQDLIIVMAVALVTAYGLQKLKIPIIVGFLLAGIIIGPGGLSLVHDQHSIEIMAEIGVVFLLFTIGLKFSVAELSQMKSVVFGAGSAQVVSTIILGMALARATGMDLRPALVVGALITMSSTAIVIKLLEERGETDAPHGRLSIGILIFQDLMVVPLMLLIPLIGGKGEMSAFNALVMLAKSAGMILIILAIAKFLIPPILERVAETRSREVFTLTTILVTIGTAWLAGLAGLSLPLGAFLAGIVISESEYSQQMLTEIAPLRDSFSSLFFISIGMLVDPRVWIAEPFMIGGAIIAVIVIKGAMVWAIAMIAGYGARVSVLAAVALAQIGEFAFILAQAAVGQGLLDDAFQQRFLSVSVLTMALTPFAIMASPWLAGRAQRFGRPEVYMSDPELSGTAILRIQQIAAEVSHDPHEDLCDHVIIVGYGINGRNVARVLKELAVKYLILELNPRTVRTVRAQGEAINYGDATREDVQLFAGIARARVLVMAIADREGSRQVVALARRLNPKVTIIVRTRFIHEVDELYRLGATEVVPEEFETSIEMAGRVMEQYGATQQAVLRAKESIRGERYGILRGEGRERHAHMTLDCVLSSAEMAEVQLDEQTHAVGKTLLELHLRERTGASVIAIARDGEVSANPGPNHILMNGDVLFIFGNASQLESARNALVSGN